MNIREALKEDFDSIWPIFHEIVKAGETYAYSVDTTKEQAVTIWMESPRKTYVFEDEGKILGTYYLKTNQSGPGSHVCNCGYMVSSLARGRGLATAMCEHSQKIARELGYKAMQFNFVASSNDGAVRLWNKLGFQTVGRLPGAFNHPVKGYVDALVMYKWLDAEVEGSFGKIVIKSVLPDEMPMSLLLEADPSESKVKEYLKGSHCFLAEIEGNAIGVSVLKPLKSGVFELMNIAVDPEYQNRGIGTKLLNHTVSSARELGAARLEVGTGTFGYQLAYYQRAGFRVFDIDIDFFLINYDEPVYDSGIQLKDMIRLAIDFQESGV